MYKQMACLVNSYCILMLVLLCGALSQTILEEANSEVLIHHGLTDDFKAEIPMPYEKIGSKYYYIDHNRTVNWFGAVEKCRQIDGHLVNLQNKLELTQIQMKLKSSFKYWTDLNNLVNGKTYYSLTTGLKGNLLNDESKGSRSSPNMCGILQFNGTNREFTVDKKKCITGRGYPICETTQPTIISFVIW